MSDRNFGVFAFGDWRKPSAQRYYRIMQPLYAMKRLGLSDIVLPTTGESGPEYLQQMTGSDIILAHNLNNEAGEDLVKQFSEMEPIRPEGKLIVPPCFVIDSDDALEYTYPMNPAFAAFGVRSWDGSRLKPGDKLTYPGANGEDFDVWVDKETLGQASITFDIERNISTIARHYSMANMAAGVTVTCEYLASMYREQGVENVYVYPNSIRESDYYYPDLVPRKKKIRLLWEGGGSHLDSWLTIQTPLAEVLKDNPHVTLVTWGGFNDEALRRYFPQEQHESHGWNDYGGYKIKRAIIDIDINLCPLKDTPFSNSKSAIRWYEGSLGPRPEAALAANIGPYKEIEDGKTGLLYDTPEEFTEKLTALIKNAELRKTLGANARRWVLNNREADKTALGLFEFYSEIKAKQRRDALSI